MKRSRLFIVATILLAGAGHALPQEPAAASQSPKEAEAIIKKMLVKGRVPGSRGGSLLNTSQAKSYKLRALWVTPEVIAASARVLQLQERLTEQQARALVEEADLPGYTIILVDLDPVEGSGVVPPDWVAFLQPKGAADDSGRAVRGLEKPGFSEKKVLARLLPRDFAYDRFWVVFPLETESGMPVFSSADQEAELIVQIRGREERVKWLIPNSIRVQLAARAPATN